MPTPPSSKSASVPGSRRHSDSSTKAAPTVLPSQAARCANVPPRPAVSDGKSWLLGNTRRTLSTVATRHTAVKPLSVANAATAITPSTTNDFRLPPPSRTRLRLPQPEASTMPMPNISPPTACDNHNKVGAA